MLRGGMPPPTLSGKKFRRYGDLHYNPPPA